MSSFHNSSQPCGAFGWCGKCHTEHRLEQGSARKHALALMDELQETERIDYFAPAADADSRFSTDYLFGPARGQMFGVLECENQQGEAVILRAFSCQYNAEWLVEGWVPPVFDATAHDRIMIPGDGQIKELGRRIDALQSSDGDFAALKKERKILSRSIMKELQALYELPNFRGETRLLAEFFGHTNGPPTGAGDCCAPKLIAHAARTGLRPLGIAEFYWGKENPSGTRQQGCFYSSCEDKCLPILGFMLCGAKS